MRKNTKNPKEDKEVGPVAKQDLIYNMTAMMYLITEQQVVIGRLMEELIKVGALNNQAVNRITDDKGNQETLNALYVELYQKLSVYVARLQSGESDDK